MSVQHSLSLPRRFNSNKGGNLLLKIVRDVRQNCNKPLSEKERAEKEKRMRVFVQSFENELLNQENEEVSY